MILSMCLGEVVNTTRWSADLRVKAPDLFGLYMSPLIQVTEPGPCYERLLTHLLVQLLVLSEMSYRKFHLGPFVLVKVLLYAKRLKSRMYHRNTPWLSIMIPKYPARVIPVAPPDRQEQY